MCSSFQWSPNSYNSWGINFLRWLPHLHRFFRSLPHNLEVQRYKTIVVWAMYFFLPSYIYNIWAATLVSLVFTYIFISTSIPHKTCRSSPLQSHPAQNDAFSILTFNSLTPTTPTPTLVTLAFTSTAGPHSLLPLLEVQRYKTIPLRAMDLFSSFRWSDSYNYWGINFLR